MLLQQRGGAIKRRHCTGALPGTLGRLLQLATQGCFQRLLTVPIRPPRPSQALPRPCRALTCASLRLLVWAGVVGAWFELELEAPCRARALAARLLL